MTSARELAIAHVQREMARIDAADEAARQATRATRRPSGASVVFSIRLDPRELAAIDARAAVIGVKPSVLARNLIRTGLAAMNSDRVAALVDQLETVVSELRTAVS